MASPYFYASRVPRGARGLKMHIKGLVLLGVMIAATIFYLYGGNLKGCTGTRVGDQPTQDSKTVAPEKR